jgi:hypothetical protein
MKRFLHLRMTFVRLKLMKAFSNSTKVPEQGTGMIEIAFMSVAMFSLIRHLQERGTE